jgi:hypothetical protein
MDAIHVDAVRHGRFPSDIEVARNPRGKTHSANAGFAELPNASGERDRPPAIIPGKGKKRVMCILSTTMFGR